MSLARALPKGLIALIRVQDFRCAYCRKAFLLNGYRFSPRSPTIEHVRPRSHGHSRVANAVVVHRRCNEAKGGRPPTGCELLALEIVNAKRVVGCVGLPGCDSDGTATAAANGDLPVPQDCQARAEGIAQ